MTAEEIAFEELDNCRRAYNKLQKENQRLREQLSAPPVADLTYWKARCLAAELVIKHSPCDLDITKDQIEAVNAWTDLKDKEVES